MAPVTPVLESPPASELPGLPEALVELVPLELPVELTPTPLDDPPLPEDAPLVPELAPDAPLVPSPQPAETITAASTHAGARRIASPRTEAVPDLAWLRMASPFLPAIGQ